MLRSRYTVGIANYWWLPLLTGIIFLGFGIWSICSPMQALPVIAIVFAVGLLAVGLFDAIWGIATARFNPGWGWDLCLAVIDIIAGVWMLTMSPENMTLTFLYIVGFWLIFSAFNGLGVIFSVSVYNPAATVLAFLLLLATLFFSFWLIINPIGLGVTAWICVGVALTCFGVFRIALAFRIKNYHNQITF